MLILLIVKAFSSPISELLQENEELRLSNEILHKQLLDFSKTSSISSLISEDFTYNKAKLSSLLSEFIPDSSLTLKLSLLDQVLYYLLILSQDLEILQINPENNKSLDLIDPIDVKELNSFIFSLNTQIEEIRSNLLNQEFRVAYQQLQISLEQKDQSIKNLQIENSQLTAAMDSTCSDLDQLMQNLQHEREKLNNLTQELDSTRAGQVSRLASLKKSLEDQENSSRSSQSLEFKKIQSNQDDLITKLQTKSSEQVLLLEELEMKKVNLLSKVRALNSSIERLENEVKTRQGQVLDSEAKFEEFRKRVEMETNNEIFTLRQEEEEIKEEVENLQTEQIKVLEMLSDCLKELDQKEMEKRQKENEEKELNLSLEETRQSIRSLKDSKGKEVEAVKAKLNENSVILNNLQNQLDEALLKLSSQNTEIRDLNDRASDLHFLTDNTGKSNLRGRSFPFSG